MATDLKGIIASAARGAASVLGATAGVAAGAAQALAGRARARPADPVTEELYWREHFASEPYYDGSFAFEEYLPAWRTGWEGRAKYPGRTFEHAERELKQDFHWSRGGSRLLWDQARPAVKAAFER
jgi:hypothetical protein